MSTGRVARRGLLRANLGMNDDYWRTSSPTMLQNSRPPSSQDSIDCQCRSWELNKLEVPRHVDSPKCSFLDLDWIHQCGLIKNLVLKQRDGQPP